MIPNQSIVTIEPTADRPDLASLRGKRAKVIHTFQASSAQPLYHVLLTPPVVRHLVLVISEVVTESEVKVEDDQSADWVQHRTAILEQTKQMGERLGDEAAAYGKEDTGTMVMTDGEVLAVLRSLGLPVLMPPDDVVDQMRATFEQAYASTRFP